MTTAFAARQQIDAGVRRVSYAEDGPSNGPAVLLRHGWPYDIHSYAAVTPLLASAGYHVLVPYLRGLGATRFRSPATVRNGQQAALALDAIALLAALHIDNALVAGFDWGARAAASVAALWPQRCTALVWVSGYLIGSQAANQALAPPAAELAWWRQYYFASERGQRGYEQYRGEFNQLIWRRASPQWAFDEATYARTAASFDNPDHVRVVMHHYRWRLGAGESRYDALEQRLAQGPLISVPTITLEGDANGAPHPESSAYRAHFSGTDEHRRITGGVGRNLPQEAPQAFAQALFDVHRSIK